MCNSYIVIKHQASVSHSNAQLCWLFAIFHSPKWNVLMYHPNESLFIIWGDFSFKVIKAQNCAAGVSYSQPAGVAFVFNGA